MPPRVLASGPKLCGGNNIDFTIAMPYVFSMKSMDFSEANACSSHDYSNIKNDNLESTKFCSLCKIPLDPTKKIINLGRAVIVSIRDDHATHHCNHVKLVFLQS